LRGFPRSDHWTPERWREITGSHYPIVRIGEGFLAMADDELTAKVVEIPASAVLEFAEHVATVVEWTRKHLEAMEAIEARLMIAIARNCEDPPPDA
jgi:hypothetical protein